MLADDHFLTEIAAKYEVQPAQIIRWKTEFLQNASKVFSKDNSIIDKIMVQHESEMDELHRQLGQLTTEVNGIKKILENSVLPTEPQKMVDSSNQEIIYLEEYTTPKQLCLIGNEYI